METTREIKSDIRVLEIKNKETFERLVNIFSAYMTDKYLLKFEPLTDGWIVYFIKHPFNDEIIKKIVRDPEEFKKHVFMYLVAKDNGDVALLSKVGKKEREILNDVAVFYGKAFKFIEVVLLEAHKRKHENEKK